MHPLQEQNLHLREIMLKCEQEILQLRKIGQQHQMQIDNLLKFNERLLSIIQNQMPNKTITRSPSGNDLHTIEEKDKQHEAIELHKRFANNGKDKPHLMDRVEHLERDKIQRLSEENQSQQNQDHPQQLNHHHHYSHNNNTHQQHKSQNDIHNHQNPHHHHHHRHHSNISNPDHQPISSQQTVIYKQGNTNQYPEGFKFINTESISAKTDNQSERNDNHFENVVKIQGQDNQQDGVIYREEKQSLIDIPKLFKLQKGLNEHYHKQLFRSVQQNKHPQQHVNIPTLLQPNRYINSRKQSIPSQASEMMGSLSQAVTQRVQLSKQQLQKELSQINALIVQYREDFNTEEYLHLCSIIKNDLENDLKEISQIKQQVMRFYETKEKHCQQLREEIRHFCPIDNLVEIMKRLNISQSTEKLLIDRVTKQLNNNGKSTVSIKINHKR